MELSFRLSDNGKSVCVSLPIQPNCPAQHTNNTHSRPSHFSWSLFLLQHSISAMFFQCFWVLVKFYVGVPVFGLGQLSQRGKIALFRFKKFGP